MQFPNFFSTDSPKAIKSRKYGYLNAINYMAPADTAGVGNLCPHASAGCKALCLGWFSGRAGMVKNDQLNDARRSRIAKAKLFMSDRGGFCQEMYFSIRKAQRKAENEGLKLCVRLNGATDIGWEGVRSLPGCNNIFELFPDVQFVDYTKNLKRMLAFCEGKMPSNYHLTFSRSETNGAECLKVLAAGGNVAVVFADPTIWTEFLGASVIDGDQHDLRHLDDDHRPAMSQRRGAIIALSPKGRKAAVDQSGFVVR